jgi:hypothetical protein
MASDRQAVRTVRRFVSRTLWTVAGVVAGLLLLFVCQDVFAGYPQYGTDVLTKVGVGLIALTGGAAWIIDHRRLDDDD